MRKTILTAGALLLAAGMWSTASAQATTRTMQAPPPPLPMKPLEFPAFTERTLKNGAQALVVQNHEQPVVSVNIYIKGAGATSDPNDKAGLAELTASLLRAGTATRTSREIAETLDGLGAQVFSNAGTDWSALTITALKADIDVVLATAADLLVNAQFPADELETLRRRTLTGLQVQLSQPAQIATRNFTARVYGGHPYGRLTTTTSLRSITRDDVLNFFRTYYKPSNALVVIAGDVNPAEILGKFEQHFAGWTGSGPARPQFAAAPKLGQREIILVNKPGAVQASYRIGHPIAPATHADWPALTVAQNILGGGSRAWLYDVLRDKKGYTYGAYAQSAMRMDPGHFFMWGDVRNEVSDSALVIFLDLNERMKRETVPAADLELAKSYLAGSFPLTIETPSQIASQIASARLLGQPRDHVQTWRQRIAAVTAADVQRVARAHFQPENAIIVISGDASVLKPKLEKFGKVSVVDEEGRPVADAGAAPPVPAVPLDASSLKPMTATYAVTFQGQPVAETTRNITRETVGGKDVVKLITSTTGMMTAAEEVVFEAKTFAPISATMSIQQGPMSMKQDVKFAGGKIVGTVKGGPEGDKDVSVDAPAGTVFSGMDDIAIMLTDFAKTKELQLSQFDPQTRTAAPLAVKLVGESKVTVAAGTFDTYDLEVTGSQGTMKLNVTKAAPHILVKQEFAAQPIVIELKSVK